MRILIERPPLWEEINAKFNVEGQSVIFAWGDTIYNPEGVKVSRELHAHEEIHGERQLAYPAASSSPGEPEDHVVEWWKRYIEDPKFRLEEELPAHRAEYQAFCKRHGDQKSRAKMLTLIAAKLTSPLYGSLITLEDARYRIIRREVDE